MRDEERVNRTSHESPVRMIPNRSVMFSSGQSRAGHRFDKGIGKSIAEQMANAAPKW